MPENKQNLNNSNPEKHLAASALVMDKDGKLLLLKHKKLGVWLYPGGHVEPHETPDETVIREVKEETGLDVEIISHKDDSLASAKEDIAALHHPYTILCEKIPGTAPTDKDHYHVDMVYLCNIVNQDNYGSIAHSESQEMDFFGPDDLDQIELWPSFRNFLEKVFKEETESI